jgi:hypothetical protein
MRSAVLPNTLPRLLLLPAHRPGVEDDGYPRGLEPHELQDTMAALHSMAALLQVCC